MNQTYKPTTQLSTDMKAIAIVGPTACGKTRRAVEAATAFDGEIISCDSRQVYTGMDIGTGKDIEEYGNIPYHLIDVCKAGERYNLFRFLGEAHNALDDIIARGKRPIICGGSGMYIENLLSGITLPDVPCNQPLRDKLEQLPLEELKRILSSYKQLHNDTDTDNPRRAIRAIEIEEWFVNHPEDAAAADKSSVNPIDALIIGVDISREDRRNRISQRLKQRLDEGMIDEAKRLLAEGVDHDTLQYYGLEYKYMSLHIQGVITYREMYEQLETAIHQFAKRQMTWLRGMERRGFKIHWLPFDMPTDKFISTISEQLYALK